MERPILFKSELVRAILSGRKTQTRRLVTGQPLEWLESDMFTPDFVADPGNHLCPFGVPGDRLWVRETFYCDHIYAFDFEGTKNLHKLSNPNMTNEECIEDWKGNPIAGSFMFYRADVPSGRFSDAGYWAEPRSCWRPSIHMPRWASRINLEITNVRIERLNDLTEADAISEGVTPGINETSGFQQSHRDAFRSLWNELAGQNKPDWYGNPWVWVIEFKQL